MNAEFRRGWRAACEAVAAQIREGVTTGPPATEPTTQKFDAGLLRLADHIEATPPPKTMTVVDENGERLL